MNDELEKTMGDIVAQAIFADGTPASGSDENTPMYPDFLFGDGIYAKLALDPGNRAILLEFYLIDLSGVSGQARELIMLAIAQCNSVGAGGRPFCIGVDNRDFAVLMNRVALDGLTADLLLEEVAYLLDQSRDFRNILYALTDGAFPRWPSAGESAAPALHA